MKIHWILLSMSLIFLPANVMAQVRTLAEFSMHLDQAASVLKTKADLEAQQSHLQANEAQKGWEVFGGVSGGYQKSPFAREPFGRFFDPAARIGLRYPLLGSAERQERAIGDAETQVRIEGIRHEWSKKLATFFVEENYAAYWSAQKMLALNDAYVHLRHAGIEKALHQRHEAGLLLMSDYFEFLSVFEQAERARLEFMSNKEHALARLSHLTHTVVAPFEAIKPGLNAVAGNLSYDINQPDLEILQEQIGNLRNVRETENWQGIDSDFSVTAFGGPAIPHPSPEAPQFGYGGAVGFNFRMPLEIVSYRKNEKSRLNSQLISFQAEYTRRDQELDLEFKTMLGRYQQLMQQIKFQQTRLDAARESVRERYLRLQALDGDVIEKYVQAINTYYRAAVEYVEAETEQWKLHVRLRQFVSTLSNAGEAARSDSDLTGMLEPLQKADQFFGKQLAKEAKPIKLASLNDSSSLNRSGSETTGFSVYAWNYDDIVLRPEFWEKSQSMGIRRVLLSLDERQIASVVSDPSPLNKFLQDARRQGVKVDWLLGDPDWILPTERAKLLEIIKRLKHIDFDGLHLDIEPDQLAGKLTGKHRLEEFVETVRQVTVVSPWPVAVSIHPRYLEKETSFDVCVPCQFKEMGVKEITVMYYATNVQTVVTAMKSAMHQYSGMLFSLAQSLERELGSDNSYAHKPQAFFKRAMLQLHNQLQAANFGGLIIQSWQDWERYIHENPL
ncbi:MAG: TolC family protein [Pseudomonadota bacterium]